MPQSPNRCRVTALDHLVLTVRDLQATLQFYENALGMRASEFSATDGTRRSALTFGKTKINLHVAGQEFDPKAVQPMPGSADLCFLTDTALEDWLTHLDALGITVEEGPVPRSGATGPILSIYLRDPDGNLIEVSTPRN